MPRYIAQRDVVLNTANGPDLISQGEERVFTEAPSRHWELAEGETVKPAPVEPADTKPGRK